MCVAQKGNILTPQVQLSVLSSVWWRAILLQSPLVTDHTLQQDGTPSHTAQNTNCTCGVRMFPSCATHVAPNSPDLNLMEYTILRTGGASLPRDDFDTIYQLKQSLVLGSVHYHSASLITASMNGNVVYNVSWTRTADTLNTHFTKCVYYIIVVIDVLLNFYGVQYEFLLQKSSSDQMCWYMWHPLASYAFIKIKLALCYFLVYVVYMCHKSLNFVDAFNCYKQ